jgi:hypothetical protein
VINAAKRILWLPFKKIEEPGKWQKARFISQKIYPLTFKKPKSVDYRMRDQLRGSVGSVMDNKAEGFERGSKNECIKIPVLPGRYKNFSVDCAWLLTP